MSDGSNRPSGEELLEIYRRMVLTRRLEEALGRLHKAGKTRGPIHRCDGQEAVGIGACAALEAQDIVTSTHRGHAHHVGKGLAIEPIVAEILGRASGACGGKAGHMLIADREHGLLGGCGIVGGAQPIAIGQALALQCQERDGVVLTFFGDGAAQIGGCHEAMNLAGLWKLPVIFFCEHNEYGLTVAAEAQSAVGDLVTRAAGYAMPGVQVDGNDALAVFQATATAAARARRGEGPSLIEARTYRATGFSTSDVGGYQSEEEMAAWRAKDPIARLRARLADGVEESRLAKIEQDASEEVETAVERALAAPPPAAQTAPEYADA